MTEAVAARQAALDFGRTRSRTATWLKRCSVAAGLTLLAGCNTLLPSGGRRPPPRTDSAPVSAPAPTENVVSADDSRHKIALLLPTSGENADIGQSIANATTLALLDINASNIRMTTYDTARDPRGAAQRAVADGNSLILGPLLGDNVVTVAGVAQQRNVPIISFSNDSGVAGRNVFILGHLPSQSIDRVVRYAVNHGKKRIAGLVPQNVYGQRATGSLTSAVRAAGGTLTAIQPYDRTSQSVDAATKALAQAGPYDAVLIADTGRAAMAAAPLLRRNGAGTAQFLGTELWNTESALAGSIPMRGAIFASVSDDLYRQYAQKYQTRFGKMPFRLSSLGYDAVLLVANIAKDWRVGTPFPVQRLTDPQGFIGIDGSFRLLPNGLNQRNLEVQEVEDGKFVTIDPAPRGF
ncbi:penicillin-binding protein activator [Novosphingopyxis iocasae]|uniref:penicillin-binding protein activator n=1 Tax=Novosphingopyxis iocasae TaxID=2762729 RepID=UPI000C610CB1|nr:penicillin-binding protein activator [Novosphingopyxis iocasae]MAC10879.1 penicillin-binding protein activator [Sphingorhabdus sp.]